MSYCFKICIFVLAIYGIGTIISPTVERLLHKQYTMVCGSAWLINEDGYIVTAGHVVKGYKHFNVTYKGEYIKADLVDVDYNNDIAILNIHKTNTAFLPLTINFKDGTEVKVYGYPIPDYYAGKLMVSDGSIYNTFLGLDVSYRGTTCPGSSGGPIIDKEGVVGIVTKDDAWYDDANRCGYKSIGPISKEIITLANKNNVLYHVGNVPTINTDTVLEIFAF